MNTRGMRQAAGTARQAVALMRPDWSGPAARGAWTLLAAVIVLTLAGVALDVLLSQWSNGFYNTLQNHDLTAFWAALKRFGLLAGLAMVTAVYKQVLQQRLVLRWRVTMTERLLRDWLVPGGPWRLGQGGGGDAPVDNPDQRIAEDVRGYVAGLTELGLGLLNAVVTLGSFVGILWGLSGVVALPGTGGWQLHGSMVWIALVYAGAGSLLAHRFGRPLIGLNAQQQRREADLRYGLVGVRDQAESIALSAAEGWERQRLEGLVGRVQANALALIVATKRLLWFSSGYAQVAVVFPLLVAAPRYFSGALALGDLIQTAQAFGQVQGSLSWFIDAYAPLAELRATLGRLLALQAALAQLRASQPLPHIDRGASDDGGLRLDGVRLRLPGAAAPVQVPPLQVHPGERLLIVGPSGAGKSTLLKAIAGLWQAGEGSVRVPGGARHLMFLPQQPQLPEGTLRQLLCRPLPQEHFPAAQLEAVLQTVGLPALLPLLDAPHAWRDRLSLGERQRLQFARALLQRPDWLFLDEATSALDEPAERLLYGRLFEACPQATVISVGHRSTLAALHHRRWSIEGSPSALPLEAAA